MPQNLDKDGLRSKIYSYELFFIDIWGVIHNGLQIFEDSIEVLENLKKNNKEFVLLTNAPRPNSTVNEFLKKMGLKKFYENVYTSGEASLKYLIENFHNSKFYNNYVAANDDLSMGGAIFSHRSVKIVNSLFERNYAGVSSKEALGGAIYLAPYYKDGSGEWKAPNQSEIVNSTFVNNYTNSGESFESTGGTIYGYGWTNEGINHTYILNSIIAGSGTYLSLIHI